MNYQFKLSELFIVVVANNNNPTILNPDFLKINNIVSDEWELKTSPFTTDTASNVQYKNSVEIISEMDKLRFSQNLLEFDKIVVPNVAKKYIETLPHVQYTHLGINPRGHYLCENIEEAQSFISRVLIKDGPWNSFSGGPKSANVHFSYNLDNKQFNLIIKLGMLKTKPVIIFDANFHSEYISREYVDRKNAILNNISEWESDLKFFESTIKEFFPNK